MLSRLRSWYDSTLIGQWANKPRTLKQRLRTIVGIGFAQFIILAFIAFLWTNGLIVADNSLLISVYIAFLSLMTLVASILATIVLSFEHTLDKKVKKIVSAEQNKSTEGS